MENDWIIVRLFVSVFIDHLTGQWGTPNRTLIVGETATLECNPEHEYGPVRHWYIVSNTGHEILVNYSDFSTWTSTPPDFDGTPENGLKIIEPKLRNGRQYECVPVLTKKSYYGNVVVLGN